MQCTIMQEGVLDSLFTQASSEYRLRMFYLAHKKDAHHFFTLVENTQSGVSRYSPNWRSHDQDAFYTKAES